MMKVVRPVVTFRVIFSVCAASEDWDLTDDVICSFGSEDCGAGLSLRQLRGEVLTSRVLGQTLPSDDDNEHGDVSDDDAAEHSDESDDNSNDHHQYFKDCAVTEHYCSDVMAYKTQEHCRNASSICRTLDVGNYGGTEGEAWLCAPKNESCHKEYMIEDFQPTQQLPLERAKTSEGDASVDLGASSDAASNSSLFHGNTQVTGHVMTLYHTTSKEIADKILHEGFRSGGTGWCGGGIYFINTPHLPKTKYAPGVTKAGAILEAKVQMGRLSHMGHQCHGGGIDGAKKRGYNSVTFAQHDGREWVIWDTQQVLSVRVYQYMQDSRRRAGGHRRRRR